MATIVRVSPRSEVQGDRDKEVALDCGHTYYAGSLTLPFYRRIGATVACTECPPAHQHSGITFLLARCSDGTYSVGRCAECTAIVSIIRQSVQS